MNVKLGADLFDRIYRSVADFIQKSKSIAT
jgi:hypothetical protein